MASSFNARYTYLSPHKMIRHLRGISLPLLLLYLLTLFCSAVAQLDSAGSFLWQPFDRDNFPKLPTQLNVKVEVVFMEDRLVEEFSIYYDGELNLARYDYALGRIMAPYNTARPMRTIHDFANGSCS